MDVTDEVHALYPTAAITAGGTEVLSATAVASGRCWYLH